MTLYYIFRRRQISETEIVYEFRSQYNTHEEASYACAEDDIIIPIKKNK